MARRKSAQKVAYTAKDLEKAMKSIQASYNRLMKAYGELIESYDPDATLMMNFKRPRGRPRKSP